MVTTVPANDAGLVQSAKAGDGLAFDELVGPLITPAYRLAVVMLRDAGEAEDAVQDSCVKAWRKLDSLRGAQAVRSWFLTIVANECRSRLRSRWWSVIKRGMLDAREPADGDIEDQIDLERELSRLSATDRAVLFLFYYLDLPLQDVGRVLKISPKAAKSRVHRAVARLRLDMAEVPK